MGSSWELYRPELEAVTFPVFVHCYLTLVMFDDQPGGGAGGGEKGGAKWRGTVRLLRFCLRLGCRLAGRLFVVACGVRCVKKIPVRLCTRRRLETGSAG